MEMLLLWAKEVHFLVHFVGFGLQKERKKEISNGCSRPSLQRTAVGILGGDAPDAKYTDYFAFEGWGG